MSDFTGFGMQDQFAAIIAEREREIARGSWRNKWKRLKASDAELQCCTTDEHEQRNHAVQRGALTPSA